MQIAVKRHIVFLKVTVQARVVVVQGDLPAGIRDLWADEHRQLPGGVVVAQGPAQHHGSPGIVVIGRQGDESLFCRTQWTNGARVH